jgi:hypothetical protein
MPWSIYDGGGQRKYLTRSETDQFLAAAEGESAPVYGFCWLIAATGCRISEALATTAGSIDFEAQHIVIESLKKREKKIFRAVPLPTKLLDWLRHCIEAGILGRGRLWPWSRMTAYRRVTEVMEKARIPVGCASPKGLRHAFGVRAIQSGAPLNLVQRWLGHADMKTTAIYTSAVGPEERAIAAKTWLSHDTDGPRTSLPLPERPARPRHFAPLSDPDRAPSARATLALGKESRRQNNQSRYKKTNAKSDASCDVIQFWLFCNLLFLGKSYT